MLNVEGVSVAYGAEPVLRNLSASFEKGRFTALIGANGCGKSTLLKAIMGFLPDARGSVTLDGVALRTFGRRELAKRIAYLPQETHCPDYMTLGELVELGAYARYSLIGGPSDKDRADFAAALETVGLSALAHHQVNTLSGGQRQRAWIAMVLAQNADTILMDEPVNHLDVKYQYAVLGLIRDLVTQHGKTVIIVLHDLNLTTSFADDVIMLQDGKVSAAGTVAGTITEHNIQRTFGLETEIFERKGRLVCVPSLLSSPGGAQ